MKLRCKKCGQSIALPDELLAADKPRIECPGCGSRYRLKPMANAGKASQPNTAPPLAQHTTDLSSTEVGGIGTPGPTGPTPPEQQKTIRTAAPLPTPSPAPPPARPATPPTPTSPSAAEIPGPTHVTPTADPRSDTEDATVISTGGTGATRAPHAPIFVAGDRLAGRYRILRFLAQGGMGEVYAAEDVELRQEVALKTVSARIGDEPAAIDRFKREIALARRVTHPNVCRIFDLGQHLPDPSQGEAPGPPITFLTMELLHGDTLSACLRQRERLSTDEALPLVYQMATALDAAHRAKVVHRDFKSENVYLVIDEGVDPKDLRQRRVVVTDFGIARGSDQSDNFASQVTGLGIVGTPAYMAPEQVENAPVITTAADIYALGIVIYEMVTGRLPFESSNPLTTAVKRLQEPPPPPHIHAPDLPAWWERAILRCLARKPEERFASPLEVAAALEKPQRPAPGQALPSPHGTRSPRSTVSAPTLPAGMPTGLAPQGASGSPSGSGALLGSAPPKARPGTAPPGVIAPPGQPTAAPALGGSPAVGPGVTTQAGTAPDADSRRSTLFLLALLLVVAVISGALMWVNEDDLDPSRVRLRPAVAVVGMHNTTGRSEADWVSTAVAEMVTTELSRGKALRAIPGDQVAAARRQLAWPTSNEPDAAVLGQLRSLVGCDYVVTGSYVSLPAGGGVENIRLDLRLMDAALGETVSSLSEEGSSGELFAMVGKVGDGLREALGVGEGGDDPFAGLPQDAEAARLYAQALDQLRDFEPEKARDSLERALSNEPENPLLHAALSSAWDALGFEQKAAAEAERAFELSSGLPQEDRLLIEGRLRQARGEWTEAMEVYRQLWESFPDDLDYGLGLVAAEAGAGQPGAALVTIDQLRRLPAPLSDDPRIDLAEASAAASAGQVDRQAEAAARAAAEAEALGAQQMLARALISLAQAQRPLGRSTEAELNADRAIRIYTELEHPPGRAEALTARANTRFDRGLFEPAFEGYREASEIHRATGDRGGLAASLNNQAVVRKRQGDLDGADRLYAETEEIYREIDDARGLAVAGNNRAVILVDRDRLAEAMERFEASEATWETIGGAAGKAYAANNIGEVLRLRGRLDESLERHREALRLRKEANLELDSLFSLANLGRLHLARGEADEAEGHLSEALALAERIGDRAGLAQVLFDLGHLRTAQGRMDDAREAHRQSLELRQELGQATSITESHRALARLDLLDGLFTDAETLALEARLASRDEQRPAEEALASAVLIEALLGKGKSAEALAQVEESALLPDLLEQPEARLHLLRSQALARGTRSDIAARTAADELTLAIEEARTLGLVPTRLELELARARLLELGGDIDGAQEMRIDIQGRASGLGLALYAERASAGLESSDAEIGG